MKEKISSSIENFKSSDPMTYEDAYHYLCSILMECKSEMINAYSSEKNPDIRGKFIEFLSLYKDETMIPLFNFELEKEDEITAPWTLNALIAIDSSESRQIVLQYIKNNPQWEFILFDEQG